MRTLKRFASAALALTLVAGMNIMPVFADEATPANGDSTATIHFHNGSNPANYSMCDSIFAHTADVTLTDDSAELTFYVAYPIPSYSDQGTDGTIKDVEMTYSDTTYTGVSDIDTKAEKTFDTTGTLFGIKTSAYVNVVMNTTQNFVVKVTDMKKNAGETTGATKTETKSAEVTADVLAAGPSYSVTIPASIAMGTLSTSEDTTADFDVEVTAEALGNGRVEIKTAASGQLKSGANSLAFTNNFGTQETSVTATLTGKLTVKATDVQKAASGNYTGTANFTINYYAGE